MILDEEDVKARQIAEVKKKMSIASGEEIENDGEGQGKNYSAIHFYILLDLYR